MTIKCRVHAVLQFQQEAEQAVTAQWPGAAVIYEDFGLTPTAAAPSTALPPTVDAQTLRGRMPPPPGWQPLHVRLCNGSAWLPRT